MMMKRFLALVLCIVLCTALMPAAHAEETADGYIILSTAEDLKAVAGAPDGKYRLTADIDMSGVDWTPIPFSGELDGNGHTIYNLSVTTVGADTAQTVDGNDKTYETVFAALFSVVKDAVIQDLTILGAGISVETDEHCFAAILAGYMENTLITGCGVSGQVELRTANVMVGTGGLAGFGSGSIRGCQADVELVIADQSQELRCEQFVGGLLACGNADMENCAVTIDAYASCRGYAHNGGLVGMFYRYNAGDKLGSITGNRVDGMITFYEDNPDRRAYCEAFGGELLSYPAEMSGNSQSFTRNEVTAENGILSPESCDEPVYTDEVVEPGCDSWGYTAHICTGCGYERRDRYAPPAHSPGSWETITDATYTDEGLEHIACSICGTVLEERTIPPHVAGEWQVVQEPTYEAAGLQRRYCVDCDRLLEEEEIPMLIGVSALVPRETALDMRCGETYTITIERIEPADAADTSVSWYSSDEGVVRADPETGALLAQTPGEAVITCVSNDGFASVEIPVRVRYTPGQWCVQCLLFGWLWNR